MDHNNILRICDGITIHMKDAEIGFITDCNNGDVFEINATTKIIIEKCNGKNTVKEIIEQVKTLDKEEVIEEMDVFEILEYLTQNNLCQVLE